MTAPPRSAFEVALRFELCLPDSAVQKAVGWDSAGVSRFLSGQQGVVIHKIESLVTASDFVLVKRPIYESLWTFAQEGASRRCTRGCVENAGSSNYAGTGGAERALRQDLGAPDSAAKRAAGWDSPNASRFLGGQQGVLIHKLEPLLNAVGLVLIRRRLFESLWTLGKVGLSCHCMADALD